MRKILICLFGLMASLLAAAQTAPDAPKREVRAVWLTTLNGLDWPKTTATTPDGIRLQQQELCHILDLLQRAHINTVLLQTRVRGTVIYPSAIEPWDGALTGTPCQTPGYDPLRFAIDECHRRGMELHAWVVTIPCFKLENARRTGASSVLRTHPELCRKWNGTWYLDPGMPGTADYLSEICTEIVRNYDVDGIHFDYIRYPEKAVAFPDASTYKRYGGGQPKADWRRQNITRCVATMYRAIKAEKPWVKVSSAPVGKFSDLSRYSAQGWNAYEAVNQDAQGWLRQGIHDMLIPMMYFTDNHFYPFALDWQEHTNGRPVVPGLGIYFLSPAEKNWPLGEITRQLHFLRGFGLSGAAFFRSEFLTDNTKGLYDFLAEDFYTTPALTPAMTWQNAAVPTAPAGLQRLGNTLVWSAAASNTPDGQVLYNLYASEDFPVDIDNPHNLKAVRIAATQVDIPARWLHGGNFAVTAINRYGNEGAPACTPMPIHRAAHFLPTDGQTLALPESDVQTILIVETNGRVVSSFRYAQNVDISRLPKGFYEVRGVLRKKKYTRRLGLFVKQ